MVPLLAAAAALHPLRAQTKTSVLPFIGSAPETGLQYGVAFMRTMRADDSLGTRPSSVVGNLVFTAKSQTRGFLEYDVWSPGNERRTLVTVIAAQFPLNFHGTGDDTPEASTPFEPLQLDASIQRHRKRGSARWNYLGARLVVTQPKTNIIVLGGTCDSLGCPIIGPALHEPLTDFGPPLTGIGYRMLLATMGRIHDSRDNLFAPRRGRVLDISLGLGGLDIEERRNTGVLLRTQVDARWYRETSRGGVWALQGLLLGNDGDVPIDQLVLFGNNRINRGYTMGRYRDHWMAASQVEWRSPVRLANERLGFAAFGGVAALGPELGRLFTGRPLPSGGAGIRFRLDRDARSSVRVDYARGVSGQSGLYVAFNEAF